MSTVTITLADSEDGATVDVKVEFGDKGTDESSAAHHMAVSMLNHAASAAVEEPDHE